MSGFAGDPTVAQPSLTNSVQPCPLGTSLICSVLPCSTRWGVLVPTPTVTVLLVTVTPLPVVCNAESSLFIFHWSPLRFGVTSGCLPCPCSVLFCHSCGCDLGSVSLTLSPVDRADSVCLYYFRFWLCLCQEVRSAAAPVCRSPVEFPSCPSKSDGRPQA